VESASYKVLYRNLKLKKVEGARSSVPNPPPEWICTCCVCNFDDDDDVSGSGISIKATTKRKLNKTRLLMFDQAIDGSTR